MAILQSNLRKILGKDLTDLFRFVLYNDNLSFGAKIFWISINDTPKVMVKKKKSFATKLNVSPATITRWIKELKKEKIIVKGKNS